MQEMPGLGILDLSVLAVGHRARGFPRVIKSVQHPQGKISNNHGIP